MSRAGGRPSRAMRRVARAACAAALSVLTVGAAIVDAQAQPSRSGRVRPVPASDPAAWRTTWAQVLRMADRREFDSVVVARSLNPDAPLALRQYAVRTLGQLPDSTGEAQLVALVGDGTGPLASDACFALGAAGRRRLADPTWALLERTALSATPASAAAVRALAAAPLRASRVVRQLLASPDKAGPALVPALIVAGLLRDVPTIPTTLVLSPDTTIARAAVYAGARLRKPGTARALVARAVFPSPPSVLSLVARGIARSAAGDSLADSARVTLERLARHADPIVRGEALQSLATYGPSAATAIERALRDPHALVRQTAAAALLQAKRGDTAAVRLAFAADTALHVREVVLATAAATAPAAIPLEAQQWGAAADWARRALFARSVLPARVRATGGDASVFDTVMVDADPRVRRAAIEGMTAAAPPPMLVRGVPERLRVLTDDASPLVRASAWGVLASGAPDALDVPRALAAWARARADTVDEDARVSIARFLGAAHARFNAMPVDSGAPPMWRPEWTEAVTALAPPDDAAEARRLLPLFRGLRPAWPVQAALPVDRPIAWYDTVVRTIIEPSLRGRRPTVDLRTTRGTMRLALDGATAPLTVDNLLRLGRQRYFDGIVFHRVVPGFVVQGGDPTGTGSGGPGYAIRDELNPTPYEPGTLGMALSGPDTGGSQWFLALAWQPHLDGGYTVFGRLVAGVAVLDAIRQHDRIVRLTVR
ncbi:MAG: peptidylprolyl isomerase [Gemmatimonadaceae bacterium]|nr:peptidylprolyl isomerase [Gemmatimonadaceae bacterium]